MERNKVTKVAIATMLLSGLAALTLASPAKAQHAQQGGGPRVNSKALEKTTYYNAPREIQIIDDRPVVRDFREAPQNPQGIDLPPGPGAGGGGNPGGGGAGALDGGGGPANIPAGGLHIPGVGTDPGYRTPSGLGLPPPKSGFGRDTNIPARGMGPRGALPDATSTNRLMGKMLNPSAVKGMAAGPSHQMAPTTAKSNGNYAGPTAQTYSGGYGNGAGGGTGGSSSVTQSFVKGSLLRH
jgi:hypothetical protein